MSLSINHQKGQKVVYSRSSLVSTPNRYVMILLELGLFSIIEIYIYI